MLMSTKRACGAPGTVFQDCNDCYYNIIAFNRASLRAMAAVWCCGGSAVTGTGPDLVCAAVET